MSRTAAFFFVLLICLAWHAGVAAQETKPTAEAKPVNGGTLAMAKTYQLKHLVAYELKIDDEPQIVVLASDRPLPLASLKEALTASKGEDDKLSLRQPHVKLAFKPNGEATQLSGASDSGTFFGKFDGGLKLVNGRVVGAASVVTEPGPFKRDLDLKFDVPLFDPAAPLVVQNSPPQKLGVSGVFKGNGKEAKLAYVSARRGEPFNDKPSIVLVFTEKDHSKAKKPEFNASFGDFGSAIVMSCHEDGGIFSCSVSHAAHAKRGFTSIGTMSTGAFEILPGQVQGELSTNGQVDTFGEKWEVNLKFAAALPAAAATPATPATPSVPKTATAPPKSAVPAIPAIPAKPPAPAAPALAAIKIKELALPAGSTDFVYKALVEHIDFKHKGDVKTVAAELSKLLAAQGWSASGSDLVTPKTASLTRKRGAAELTIFVKPGADGTDVRMFTKGLDWGE